MSQPFVGEIRMFAGNFPPAGWAFCNGQLLSIADNDALFTLLGTTYGGDGQSTFALPDLRGRIPVHAGSGPGLSNRIIGQSGGQERVALNLNQVPSHTHAMQASSNLGSASNPAGKVPAESPSVALYVEESPSAAMNSGAIENIGGGQVHDNLMPFLCISFIISLFGIFPSSS